MAVLSIVK